MRRWMVAATALALAGCGGGRLEDRLVACPQLSLPADAADLTRYLPNAPQDLSTLVLDARITAVDGSCRRGRRDQTVDATISVRMRVDRGPAATTRAAELPWFIAVVQGDEVLSRQGFVLPVAFAPNTTRAELATPAVEIAFPARQGRRIQDMRVLVGFRLSPEELALNRRRGPQ